MPPLDRLLAGLDGPGPFRKKSQGKKEALLKNPALFQVEPAADFVKIVDKKMKIT